ncbi:MAG: radical SAM protein [Candidatus Bathyarchaeota archaeon]|nr:radical SAM protein [Candidatus Bathyarchaeota archaeon]
MGKERHNLKEVCLEITDVCPMNCLHCSGSCGLDLRNMLSLQQIKGIIDDLASMDGEILEISGGEPLMHPNLLQIVAFAEKNNLENILYTSGIMLGSNGRIASININVAEKLRQAGLKKVIFNLQGDTSNIHENITQIEGSFIKVQDSIRIMKSVGCWVGVHFVPMKPNYSKLKKVIQLCHKLGVDEIGLLRFVPQGRGLTNRELLELPKEEFQEFIENTVKLKSFHENPKIRVGRPINFCPLVDVSIIKEECDAGISRCLISPKGNVVPCPAFKRNVNYIAGNVKVSALADIWHYSPVWRYFRQFDYTKMNEPCGSCEHLHWCQGGCKAQRILEYGNMYGAPDPQCFAPNSQRKELVEQIC